MFEIVHDESVKVYLHMYDGNVQQNSLCVKSCVTKKFYMPPRFSSTIFDPDANSVLLRAQLCTAVHAQKTVCSKLLKKSVKKVCTTGTPTRTLYAQHPVSLNKDIHISPQFSPVFFYHDENSVLLPAHLCTAVLIDSMRRTLCSNLFMMRAWRPIYTYVQRESSAEPSMRRTLCDWGVFHLSSVLANHIWSPSKFSALTSTPSYSSTPTSTSLYSGKQYFGEIKSEVIFIERKDPEGVNSRSARPSASCTYWVYSNERVWPCKQFNILVGAIDQLPTPLQQKWRFPHEPNRFLETLLTIWTFLKTTVTLDWNIVHFLFLIFCDRIDKSLDLSRRRAEWARWFKK